MTEQSDRKRERCSSFDLEEVDLPEVKKLRENLLEDLEDDDICSTSADLDSFMRSFEEEITSVNFPSVTDLGYLLEASDDDLGLPPSIPSPSKLAEDEVVELVRDSPDLSGLGELLGFDEDFSGFDDPFDLAIGCMENGSGVGKEFVAVDGLFDYSDMGFGGGEFVSRPETLPTE